MTRRFARDVTKHALGAALAAALALSAAVPARASEEEVAAVAAASFFVAFIADLIAATQGLDRTLAVQPAASAVVDAGSTPTSAHVDPRKSLPAACRFDLGDGSDRGTWYGGACLVENFAYWPYLPDRCEASVALPGAAGEVPAYDAGCLAHFGYRPARAGRALVR